MPEIPFVNSISAVDEKILPSADIIQIPAIQAYKILSQCYVCMSYNALTNSNL